MKMLNIKNLKASVGDVEILKGIEIISEATCFDVCDILRLKLTGYVESINLHVMNDGSGYLFGCICR